VLVHLTVNGVPHAVETHPMARLLDLLRTTLHLTGTKEGCGEGECGACAVLLDGDLVNSCLVPAAHSDGTCVTTIEGLASGDRLHAIQAAFLEHGAAQCGICTPGMIMAAVALQQRGSPADAGTIRDALSGNLCRCTGYVRIVAAVQAALASGAE
jgi:carbon-monoxide dehydrogenase small subunit